MLRSCWVSTCMHCKQHNKTRDLPLLHINLCTANQCVNLQLLHTQTKDAQTFPFIAHNPLSLSFPLTLQTCDPFCVPRLGRMSSPWASEVERWQRYAGGREVRSVTWPCRRSKHPCYERPQRGSRPPPFPLGCGWPLPMIWKPLGTTCWGPTNRGKL